jgi:Domain of unknown function (DUF4499)
MSISHRPNLLWRLFVLVGLGTAGAVTLSDEAWEQWHNVAGDTVPRDVFRSVFWGSAALHVAEGGVAYVSARRGGLERPGRWARATVLWGFPVLFRLRRAKRAAALEI